MRGHRTYLDQPDDWTNRGFYVPRAKPNVAQDARRRGEILPMETPSLFQRMREWVRR